MNQQNVFQALFQYATIGIIVVNSNGRIERVNTFAAKLFGYEQEDLIDQLVEVLVPESSRKNHTNHREAYHNKPVEREMGAGLELSGKRKDGTTFPLEISLGHTVIDGQKMAIAYINDISKQKRVQRYNRDISKIMEDSLNEIFIFDADSLKFVLVNEGGRKNIGYSLGKLQELTPIDIKPDYTWKEFQEVLIPLKNGDKEKIIFETVHERKDKTRYPVEIHLQYATLDGQAVFVAIIMDITERKENEKKILGYSQNLEEKIALRTNELRASEERLKFAQRIARIGHWDWWMEEKRISLSAGMYRILGLKETHDFSADELIGYIHPEDRSVFLEQVKDGERTGKGYSISHRICTPKGEIKFIQSDVQDPILDASGKLVKLFGVSRDVTSLKESEIKLEETLSKERELGLLKSRFVSMASHEFRTPLSSILSSAELLGLYIESGRYDKCGKNIERIKSSVRNLTGILNDFLSLEKLEAGKIEVQLTAVDLNDFLEELLEEIKPLLRPSQLLNFKNPISRPIQTDPYLLKNILINLTSNAIKYSPKGPDVLIEIEEGSDHFLFQVIDQGIGIPPEDIPHMFSRFFRASNVENIKGTGLGLTIVKRYLDLLGGTIDFESEYGKGSTFYFKIPILH